MLFLVFAGLTAALLLTACSAGGSDGERTITTVFEEHRDHIMSLPGVVGMGVGDCSGSPCIRVFVTEKTDAVLSRIPEDLDGYKVEVVESGEFRPR